MLNHSIPTPFLKLTNSSSFLWSSLKFCPKLWIDFFVRNMKWEVWINIQEKHTFITFKVYVFPFLVVTCTFPFWPIGGRRSPDLHNSVHTKMHSLCLCDHYSEACNLHLTCMGHMRGLHLLFLAEASTKDPGGVFCHPFYLVHTRHVHEGQTAFSLCLYLSNIPDRAIGGWLQSSHCYLWLIQCQWMNG